MMRIKLKDTVVVITGPDKGKKGKVIGLDIDKNLVKIKGVAIITKHQKARRQGETSAIKKEESFINLSNVMLVCPGDSKPCRVNYKVSDDGKKLRISNRTKEAI